jgi:hypothetical protein
MKMLALTATLGVAAMLAGCNKTNTTAAPGVIDTPACCADKSKCADSAACAAKKATAGSCPMAARAAKANGASACCASKKAK